MQYPRYIIEVARKLRKDATPEEKLLWQRLRNRKLGGLKFVRQHPLGRYVVDFYCSELKLVVEIEGSVHRKPDQLKYDETRFEELGLRGFRILRYSNSEIAQNLENVLESILRMKQLTEFAETG